MRSLLSAISITLVVTGCAAHHLSRDDLDSFSSAESRGDTPAAAKIIETQSSLTESDAYQLVVAATEKSCDDETVLKVLERSPRIFGDSNRMLTKIFLKTSNAGLRHGGADLANWLLRIGCPNALQALIPHVTHDELAIAATGTQVQFGTYGDWDVAWEQYPQKASALIHAAETGIYPANFARLGQTFRVIREALDNNCKVDGDVSASCRSAKTLDGLYDEAVAIQRRLEFNSSAAGIAADACRHRAEQVRMQREIDHEHQAGAISGFVNANTLHEDGLGIVNAQKKIDALAASYRKMTGKALDLNGCPTH